MRFVFISSVMATTELRITSAVNASTLAESCLAMKFLLHVMLSAAKHLAFSTVRKADFSPSAQKGNPNSALPQVNSSWLWHLTTQLLRRRQVKLKSPPELMNHHTIIPPRRFQRDVTGAHVGKNFFRSPFQRTPETTAAGGLDQE